MLKSVAEARTETYDINRRVIDVCLALAQHLLAVLKDELCSSQSAQTLRTGAAGLTEAVGGVGQCVVFDAEGR